MLVINNESHPRDLRTYKLNMRQPMLLGKCSFREGTGCTNTFRLESGTPFYAPCMQTGWCPNCYNTVAATVQHGHTSLVLRRPMFVMMAYELVCMHCLGIFCGECHCVHSACSKMHGVTYWAHHP